MPKLSAAAAQARGDAFTQALKRLDPAPAFQIIDFPTEQYGIAFLRALKKHAEALKAPHKGRDGTYGLFRARFVPSRDPERLEVFRTWLPRD